MHLSAMNNLSVNSGPDESVVRAYAVTPASGAAARGAGSVKVSQLPAAAKPPQAGQLSGSRLTFAVSGLALAPELVADAVQARPRVLSPDRDCTLLWTR